MKRIKTINISEDKIFRFDEFEPTKYNGNVLMTAIMEWLRAKLLDNDLEVIQAPLEQFFQECKVDKNKFLTFVKENDVAQKAKNFSVKIEGDQIIFSDFKNNEENNETN